MSGRDRNRPCWCGSGRKYKKCHLGREDQQHPSIWDASKKLRSIFKAKACLHPQAGPATCKGQIVRAHTVRRSADLSAIARNGHVYQVSADLADLNKNQGKLVPKLVGINDASTFWGFCEHHDSSTFAPLEAAAFTATAQQLFLLAYRPLCKELYLKRRALESSDFAKNLDKGRNLAHQADIQEFIALMQIGIKAAIADLERHKKAYDADMLAGDYTSMRSVIVWLDKAPDIMCSSMVQPHYTFDGKLIQEIGDVAKQLDFMSFSLISVPPGGAVVFAWRSDSDRACSQFVDSLVSMSETKIPNAIVRYATSEFENTYMSPLWWEGLRQDERDALIGRLSHNVGPTNRVAPNYLKDDGQKPVNWVVQRIDQKRK